MRVEYIKDGFGHPIGAVIDATSKVANTLVAREICKFCEGVVLVDAEKVDAEKVDAEKVDAEKVEPVIVEPVTVEPVTVEPVAVEPVIVEPVIVEPKEVFDISTMDYAAMKAMLAKLGIKANGHTIPALKKALTTYQNDNK